MSSRSKGKRCENELANELKSVWPDCHRNWQEQSAKGGVDLANTGIFGFEVKSGKQANIAKIRKWLDQTEQEADPGKWCVVIGRPIREEKYVVMPWQDFKEILEVMKAEGII